MTLVVFCETCNYEYSVIAYTVSNTATDGKLSKCPKCKKRSRVGFIVITAKTNMNAC